MYDAISIGAATVDIFVKSPSFIVKDNLLSIGYASKNEMSDSVVCSGGGATNSSVSLSRLGLKTACLSLLGNDPMSLYVFNDLEKDKVDTSLLIHQDNETTDYSVILVADDGGRSILTNRGPTFLKAEHIDWDVLSKTEWLYITSLEGNLDLLEQIVGFAVEQGIKISLNPGNRELKNLVQLTPLISQVDFLQLNTVESEILTGQPVDSPGFWEKLQSFGAQITAVTNGRQGAYILLPDGQKLFSPIINTHPADETGAGDSFGSAFVGGLIHHLSPQDALFWAIKNSASVVSYLGAKPGLLALSQIKV